ncbi:DUF4274 domain-containing protein [Shewanella algae]|uniref:DUF4274 domain-containing protein n=1 Tax=Shewanella algae TaxID=38313 RepID=UPI001AAE820C|nr:DUF4274 domain-containing protein [Shewanella algae]MBO2638671.1 DUF4274 domain-containing protein [Shewanella algae]
MAKRLTQEQFFRAFECAESGAICDTEQLKAQLADPEIGAALAAIAGEFAKTADSLMTIAELQSMEELHYVAANLNWDNGLASPAAILNHPLCDAGTALLLYWYGQGFFHSNPADAEPEEKALFDRLITRFSQGDFVSYRIAFDAIKEDMLPPLKQMQERGWQFPGILLAPYSTMEIATYQGDYQTWVNQLLGKG